MDILGFIYWLYDIEPHVPGLAAVIIIIFSIVNNIFWFVGFVTVHRWAKRKREQSKVCAETE